MSYKSISYITKIGNKSPRIPYYGQWLWPCNIFEWLCVFPFLRSGLSDGRVAVTSLEHKRIDITQHLLALCDQTAAHAKAPPHHLSSTDCHTGFAALPKQARESWLLLLQWRAIMIRQHERPVFQLCLPSSVLSSVPAWLNTKLLVT